MKVRPNKTRNSKSNMSMRNIKTSSRHNLRDFEARVNTTRRIKSRFAGKRHIEIITTTVTFIEIKAVILITTDNKFIYFMFYDISNIKIRFTLKKMSPEVFKNIL
ncbi:hypothetical protein D3C71_1849200 [compost metagenome]